jgi:hypothetical protein
MAFLKISFFRHIYCVKQLLLITARVFGPTAPYPELSDDPEETIPFLL